MHTTDASAGAGTARNAPPALLPAALLAGAALFLFGFELDLVGYPLLAAALLTGFAGSRELGRDTLLIGAGLGVVSLTSVAADVSWPSFFRIGTVLALAVIVPVALDRLVFRRRVIRFPWRSRQKKSRAEIAYLIAVPVLGWLILPFYFVSSGAYQNWPSLVDGGELARFFVGVNAVGTWDELFFICITFALLRRHLPLWPANLLTAVIFVSFLWELGYRSWGPLLTFPFALLQGYLFDKTKSLGYVLIVHLLFDAIVFLAIVNAHHPGTIPFFLG
ncbi:CPBP family intramembrane glutamic endopeptidase [Leucobacter sp. M11]|uniref:CPBP family intramembrane glutamic endopeptidase n=1 Tax=Leucobacter sp. M11 TaxID=2993565 RepID=UPI002D80BB90|nr:type II CAAX endopeptidase family protein [Leucobacter sp. M11]MEB4616451.1 type II CAAX endopeptidase family protein [Leucobacter sp. M11]